MKLSTKSRYAVTALFDLAAFGAGKPVSAVDISKRQGISMAYLEQIFKSLRKAGIVKTQKGPSGGYMLAKNPTQVSVGEIIRAADGSITFSGCVEGKKCSGGCCSTRALWNRLSGELNIMLNRIKLSDLVKAQVKGGG